MRPVACMVTDRSRFAGSLSAVVAAAGAAAAGGVHLIQVRERDLEGRALFQLTQQILAAVRGTSARVLVNDRVDVALAAHAHGVHLRARSVPPSRVRAIVPRGFLIGLSIHSPAEAAMAGTDADYLIFGSVFSTSSKPGRAAAGLDALGAVVRSTSLPVLAIGGVDAGRVREVINAGAAGFAGISMFGGRESLAE